MPFPEFEAQTLAKLDKLEKHWVSWLIRPHGMSASSTI